MRISIAAVFAVSLAVPSLAGAQPADNPRNAAKEISRAGLFGGASIGPGAMKISCPDCRARDSLGNALSLTGTAGYMLSDRLAVVGEYWHLRWSDRDNNFFGNGEVHDVRHNSIAVGAQVWVVPRAWLRASIGAGRHTSTAIYARNSNTPRMPTSGSKGNPMTGGEPNITSAAHLAAGFELAHSESFAFDLQLRVGGGRADDDGLAVRTTSLSLGGTWF